MYISHRFAQSQHPMGLRILRQYPIGYASRCLAVIHFDSHPWLLSANVGDSSVTAQPLNDAHGKHRSVSFPERSAPIGIAGLPIEGQNQPLLLALFNDDFTEQVYQTSHLLQLPNLSSLLDAGERTLSPNKLPVLLSREGHWGFRSVAVFPTEQGSVIAATDRLSGELHVAHLGLGENAAALSASRFQRVALNYPDTDAIPICIGALEHPQGGLRLLVNQQGKHQLSLVEEQDGRWQLSKRIDVPGASRANLASGHFRNPQTQDLAIAIWGGDPKDLATAVQGEIAIIAGDSNLDYTVTQRIPAGIHPTEIVALDLDGDGLDELAVLNYGTGLNEFQRGKTGGLEIYKYLHGCFKKVAELKLPNPRTAIAHDVDGDGIPELLVSLFYESRVIAIKATIKSTHTS